MSTDYTSDRESYPGRNLQLLNLSKIQRSITGNRCDGKAYFEIRDSGDNVLVRRAPGFDCEAVETNIYRTFACPVDLNNGRDLHTSLYEWRDGHHTKNGTRVTILEFSPGAETPMHRGGSIDYNVVIEGEIELILDSGESTRMRRGDVNVQRATNHKWRNVSASEWARMFNVLVDIEPLFVAGEELKGHMEGYPGPYGFGIERLPSVAATRDI